VRNTLLSVVILCLASPSVVSPQQPADKLTAKAAAYGAKRRPLLGSNLSSQAIEKDYVRGGLAPFNAPQKSCYRIEKTKKSRCSQCGANPPAV
jgi:hypothetical protein